MFPSPKECLDIINSIVDPRQTKIIIHTGGIAPVGAAEFLKMGVFVFLTKPESYSIIKADLLALLAK